MSVYTSVQKSAAVSLLYGSHIANQSHHSLITQLQTVLTEAVCLNILLLPVWQTENMENCDRLFPNNKVVTSQETT
jgi:hypothetical protein